MKKRNFILLMGGCILASIFLIVLLLVRGNQIHDIVPEPTTPTVDVNLPADEDQTNPFTDPSTTETTIESLQFNKPVLLKGLSASDSAQLVDSSDTYLLFLQQDKQLFLYRIDTGIKIYISDEVTKATLSPDNKYVVYSKTVWASDVLFAYNVDLQVSRELQVIFGGTVSNILAYEGQIFYSYPSLDDPAVESTKTSFYLLPEYTSSYPINLGSYDLDPSSDVYDYYNHNIYLFNPAAHAINLIQLGNQSSVYKQLDPSLVLTSLRLSENGDLFYIANRSLYYQDQILSNFTEVTDASWIDGNHIAVLKDQKLWVYNTQSKQSSSLIAPVSAFRTEKGVLYYQDLKGDSYQMTIEQK